MYLIGDNTKGEIEKLIEKKGGYSVGSSGSPASQWHSWMIINDSSTTLNGMNAYFAQPIKFNTATLEWTEATKVCLVITDGTALETDKSYMSMREGSTYISSVRYPVYSTCGCGADWPIGSTTCCERTCWDVVVSSSESCPCFNGVKFRLTDNHYDDFEGGTLGGCEGHISADLVCEDNGDVTFTVVFGGTPQTQTITPDNCDELVFHLDPDGDFGCSGDMVFTLTPCGLTACCPDPVPVTLYGHFSGTDESCSCLEGFDFTLNWGDVYVGFGPTHYNGWTTGVESIAGPCEGSYFYFQLWCDAGNWWYNMACSTGGGGTPGSATLTPTSCDPFVITDTVTFDLPGTSDCCANGIPFNVVIDTNP